jgi:hypothetical protein|tara:strand:+ start:280 stop:762 length:483 start_codon:yes stop_codon:yes gene_type:complete
MAKVRLDEKRENTVRETESRAQTAWKPPSMLDAPPCREGMVQRWVSTSILGKDMTHHVMKRRREGWIPRPADTVPSSFPVPSMDYGQWKGCVGIEGMILCEMTEDMAAQRNEYYRNKSRDAMAFTERDLAREEKAGGVPIEREFSSGAEGGGRRLTPMDD